jgi:PAS domain S-box-containing protein
MDRFPIDKILLRLPPELEDAYQEETFHSSLKQVRVNILVVAAIYALFGIVDAVITPEVRAQAWFIRYVVIVPTALSVLAFSYAPQFKRWQQATVSLLSLVGGAGVIGLIVLTFKQAPYIHFAGLLLVFMTTYTAFKLRFLYATAIGWFLILLYEVAALWISNAPLPEFLTNNFFFISANLMGMFTNYQRELHQRREFYQNRMLQVLEKEKHTLEKEQMYTTVDRAIMSLRESELKFRALAETAPLAIFIHQGGKFLYANRAAEIIGGYAVKEYFSMSFLDLVHPEYADLVSSRERDRLAGKADVPGQYEFKLVRKNGDERWVLMTGGITQFEGMPAVIGTLFDVTSRRHAEQEREEYYHRLQTATQSLKESESRFRTLAETTSAGIFIYREGRLIDVNPAGVRMTGYDIETLLSMDFSDLIHPDHREMVSSRAAARLRGEEVPAEYEFKVLPKGGAERWVRMTGGVIEYEGRPAVIATMFDTTDRKLAEEEKERQHRERLAEEKRHFLEKEKILMDLHDGIGGVTTNIGILAELAQKATDPDDVKEKLAIIALLSREGMSEIRNFMHSLDADELDWKTLASALRSQGAALLAPHAIGFSMESNVDSATVRPDSLVWMSIWKVYKEALTNVIKHANAGTVTVDFVADANRVALHVVDDGSGKHEAGEGRGLANMKRRSEELGGTLVVTADRGTTVKLEIPLPVRFPLPGAPM